MPRNENGLSWRAWRMAATCGSSCWGTLVPLRLVQDSENSLEWNVDPGRPVRQLVRYLVDGLFEHEERCHRARLALARRKGGATAHGLAISSAEAVHCPLPPCFGQLRHSRLRRRPCFGELPHRRDGGVIERADH